MLNYSGARRRATAARDSSSNITEQSFDEKMRKSLMTALTAAALCVVLTPAAASGQGRRAKTREVKVYLVAVGDAGKAGRKIGCDDSLVAVTRGVKNDGAPLRAAVRELLSMPREYEGGLGNYWHGEGLRVAGATISRGTATIRITGRLFVAGVCDEPRIEEQIKETARQFPGVRRVNVFVNGRPLARVIR